MTKNVSLLVALLFSLMHAHADEIRIATGVNTSAVKTRDKQHAEYQKVDIFNPVEISYLKNIIGFLGINTSVRYLKRSISEEIERMDIQPDGTITSGGYVTYENICSYFSLELSPQFRYNVNRLTFDARLGLSGDVYIREHGGNFGDPYSLWSEQRNPLVWSITGGVGIGYRITERFKLGIGSSVSSTVSDIYKKDSYISDMYYVNFQNVLFAGFSL